MFHVQKIGSNQMSRYNL